MSRQLWGEGSLFQQADGRYVATFTVNGERKRVRGRTPKEANDKRKAALKRLANGLPATEPRMTFAVVANRWKDVTSHALNLTADSRRAYVDVLALHVEPIVGAVRISQMRPSHVEEVMVAMRAKGLSPSYCHQAHKAMSHVFKLAIRDGLITSNPTREVPAPRGSVVVKVVPGRDVVRDMVDLAPDERLRISELLSLTWADVNYETKSIAVLGKGGKRRAVYVTPTLESQLRVWKVEQARERLAASWWSTEGDWIITTSIGTRMDAHNWRKEFKPFADAIAPGVTPHSLRHAFATLMLEEGVPMRVVADQMGHSSTRITEETYSHVTARLQAEAGAAIERAIGSAH
jgi:site-specific recombinase XerD